MSYKSAHHNRQDDRATRAEPWQPVFERPGESQPQGLLDFPPGTNVHVVSHVSFWRLFLIQLSNLLFSVISLGTYRFWGRSRLRRSVWHGIELVGNRLIYHGTGLELFVSAFVAVIGLLPPLTFLALSIGLLPFGQPAWWVSLGIAVVLGYFLHFMGLYYRYRYWAIKTTWRGIRGRLSGNASIYALLALWQGFLTLVTLGLNWPRMQMRLAQYLAEHLSLGSFEPRWVEQRAELRSAWILVWGQGLLTAVAWLGVFMIGFWSNADTAALGLARSVLLAVALVGCIALPLQYIGYQVALVRSVVSSLALQQLYVFSRVDFGRLLWLYARIFAIYVAIALILGMLAWALSASWSPVLDALAAEVDLFLIQREAPPGLRPSLGLTKWTAFAAVFVALVRWCGQTIVPLLGVAAWLKLHEETLVFEGELDFASVNHVGPGQYRSLGEGVALAFDAGGI